MPRKQGHLAWAALFLGGVSFALACGGTDSGSPNPAASPRNAVDLAEAGPGPAGSEGGSDSGAVLAGEDGVPSRPPCTGNLGTALSEAFGRLDGYLVAVVAPGKQRGCHGDTGHLHLQVKSNEATYDVAITLVSDQAQANVDVFLAEKDAPMANGAWAEGWHSGVHFDYAQNLGLHAANFNEMQKEPLLQRLQAAVATANHISIYATGYGPDGAHKVHRNGGGEDGAIVLQPTSAKPHFLAFHFANQSF